MFVTLKKELSQIAEISFISIKPLEGNVPRQSQLIAQAILTRSGMVLGLERICAYDHSKHSFANFQKSGHCGVRKLSKDKV